MSIVCCAKANNQITISCDTQSNCGSLTVSARQLKNSTKLYKVNGSIIGIVGWSAVSNMIEHLISRKKKIFKLGSRTDIFTTLLQLHKEMKETYYLETREEDDQPVESNQFDSMIINKNGIFGTASYREVNEYNSYWAIGSGKRLALGAMHALIESKMSAQEITEAAVMAAAEFDDGCGLPLVTEVIELN